MTAKNESALARFSRTLQQDWNAKTGPSVNVLHPVECAHSKRTRRWKKEEPAKFNDSTVPLGSILETTSLR